MNANETSAGTDAPISHFEYVRSMAAVVLRELRDEHVRRLAGEERGARDDVALVDREQQVGAEPPRRRPGLRVVRLREAARDGKHHAAGARAVGRQERGEERVGRHERVREAERAAAERADEQERDAPPEPGLEYAAREEERAEHEPDDAGRNSR